MLRNPHKRATSNGKPVIYICICIYTYNTYNILILTLVIPATTDIIYIIYIYFWLVVLTILKNMKVSWDDDIPNGWKNKKCSKPSN